MDLCFKLLTVNCYPCLVVIKFVAAVLYSLIIVLVLENVYDKVELLFYFSLSKIII